MIHSSLGNIVEWERRLSEKVAADPLIARKLAELMWLDGFLMDALQADPFREFPEMQRAWSLCLELAGEIGLPRDAGADWLSFHATPIGRKLGLMPAAPESA